MASAHASIDLIATADEVWQLIGGFGSLPDWLPYIPKSELSDGGRIRSLTNPEGATIVERLLSFDHAARSYSYSILTAGFPVTTYVSTLRVVEGPSGKGARVEWSGQFTPDGVSDEQASESFRGIYEEGLRALASHLTKQC
ncbi:SRPBCC family protein [Sinorhizobium chiapasense]|uniref:SRPBCC family protein n=1 Tax=Sinorhizobium chiapasense TaxID=501572 RepID=A0ABZ2BKK2_9HYPH